MRFLICCFAFVLSVQLVLSQPAQTVKANYNLAAKFSPKRMDKMIFSTTVTPHWFKKSDRFWYSYETTEGKRWYLVDPLKSSKKTMFDNAKLAAEITRIIKDPFDAQHLPIDSIQLSMDEKTIRFEIKSSEEIEKKDTTLKKGATPVKEKKIYYFEYNLETAALVNLSGFVKPKHKPMWAAISPDGQTIVFSKKFNLYWMDKVNYEKALKNEDDSTIVENKMTDDGMEDFSYGTAGSETNVDKEKNKDKRKGTFILWSPNSKHFTMIRADQRKVKDLWVINNAAEPRPTLETYKYQMPGEKDAAEDHLLLFDAAAKTHKELSAWMFKNQDLALWLAPAKENEKDDEWKPSLWHGTNEHFYLTRSSRDLKKIDVLSADVSSGEVKSLIEESMNTYVEVQRVGLVNGGKELIEWSERDGWGHFYLYDGTGKLKNQITSGEYHCNNIVGIDEAKRILYFNANGNELNEDPYYQHVYKINFDGTGLALLNGGSFDHSNFSNDNNTFFVDNFSRVNTVPVSVLCNADGKKILNLETADLRSLFATGYKFPEIVKLKADDGITDLYGVVYKPYDFDSTKKYPIVEYVYPGPQTEAVNKAFARPADRIDRLAQIGLIVLTVGNRGGNPARSKWYHNYGYGNLRDYGLADKKAAIEQMADRYPYIDISKVGIHGHSGGGFMSTAAMLIYPDFFKVAVSSSGNHDNSVYNRWWSEKHNGVREVISDKQDTSFVYNIEKNQDLAKNLKGHLMLTTGDIDNNVHPANSVRVANALIKANKRFDIMVLPGQRHGYGDMQEWFFWGLVDYYSKWLLGDFSQPVDMLEMNRDIQQSDKKGK